MLCGKVNETVSAIGINLFTFLIWPRKRKPSAPKPPCSKSKKDSSKKAGILLAEIGASKKSKQQLASTIAWGVDYLNGGILLTMQNYNFTKAIDDPEYAGELSSLAPPWNGPAQPAGLKTNWTIGIFSMSPSGDWLAGGFAAGDWTARVWDWRRKTLHFEVPHTRAVQWVRFSHDSQYLFSLGGEEFTATSITEKRPLVTIKGLGGARSATVHPSGKFAVVALQDHIEILDLDRQAIVNRLWMNRGMETIDPFENNPGCSDFQLFRRVFATREDSRETRHYCGTPG